MDSATRQHRLPSLHERCKAEAFLQQHQRLLILLLQHRKCQDQKPLQSLAGKIRYDGLNHYLENPLLSQPILAKHGVDGRGKAPRGICTRTSTASSGGLGPVIKRTQGRFPRLTEGWRHGEEDRGCVFRTRRFVRFLRDYAASLESDPAASKKIEARLHTIEKLKKKYGPTVKEALQKKEAMDSRPREGRRLRGQS